MKARRLAVTVVTLALLGSATAATADDSLVLEPKDHHTKCHVLGNGGYIVIAPSSRSYVTEGHGTRNDLDVYGEFSFRQNDNSEKIKVNGKANVEDLERWLHGGCTAAPPIDEGDGDGDTGGGDTGGGDTGGDTGGGDTGGGDDGGSGPVIGG